MHTLPSRRAALALALLLASPATATSFTVSKLTDSNDGTCDADCSLREAVVAANAAGGTNNIVLGLGVYQLSLAGAGEEAAATGDLDVTAGSLAIAGLGARQTAIDGGDLDRIFDLKLGAGLALQGLAVRNGRASGSGGGIRSSGTLTLLAVAVEDNETTGMSFGGGIAADSGGTVAITRSTLARNMAAGGGGGAVFGIGATLENVTFSGNSSVTDFGGGLYLFSGGAATVNNATFTLNQAPAGSGGGVYVEGGATLTLANTILAGNGAVMNPDCSGGFTSAGHNLLGINAGCSGSTVASDLFGTSASPLAPRLSPLHAKGGTTDTHEPLAGSPATDAGSPDPVGMAPACLAEDQRNLARPGDGNADGTLRCDIGAHEAQLIFADGFEAGTTAAWTLAVP